MQDTYFPNPNQNAVRRARKDAHKDWLEPNIARYANAAEIGQVVARSRTWHSAEPGHPRPAALGVVSCLYHISPLSANVYKS